MDKSKLDKVRISEQIMKRSERQNYGIAFYHGFGMRLRLQSIVSALKFSRNFVPRDKCKSFASK